MNIVNIVFSKTGKEQVKNFSLPVFYIRKRI